MRQDVSVKKIRIVLIFYSPDGCDLSISLASLSAYLKAKVTNVEIFLESINTTLSSPAHTVSEFSKRVKKLQPDLVGVSCMSPHWYALDPYLTELKRLMPDLPVLLGGYQAILEPDETIAHPAVDFICVGDGELPFEALANRIANKGSEKIQGLWEKRDGRIEKTSHVLFQNLDCAPYLDYSIFEKNGSLQGLGLSIFGPSGKFILPVMTGRGCPYLCSYCCNTTLAKLYKGKGRYLRKYDGEILIDELISLKEKYGVDYFEFWDEHFLSNMDFVYKFMPLYQKKIGLPFSINSRVEIMNDNFCREVSESGCDTIWFGIESGSELYRHNYLNRKMTNDQIIAAADNAKKYGIRRLTFNMVGMPFETPQNMRETLLLNQQIQPEHFFFFGYIPLSGTPLYELAKEKGLLIDSRSFSKHYQEGNLTGNYRLNIKESVDGMNTEEFCEICTEMETFQRENNGLSMDDETAKVKPCRVDVSALTERYEKFSFFSFPLNVYAYLLLLEEGQADNLCFGLYLKDDISFPEAQRQSTNLIRSFLPSPPCRILEVGIGLGTTAGMLADQGYQVHGISPDTQQVEIAYKKVKSKALSTCESFETYQGEEVPFDLILSQESAQYIDPLVLFSQASRLLTDDGRLLILDEFALHRTEPGLENLHLLKDFIALGERCGFELLEQRDLSAAAAPTVDYILRATTTHRQSILENLDITADQLDQLNHANRLHRDKYTAGRFGYALLCFQKKQIPRWRLSELDESHSEEFLALFAKIFGQTMPQDFWRRKYGDGRGHSIAAWSGNQLVGHYGGQGREILFKGRQELAVQNGDVMVDVMGRVGMSSKGPYALMIDTFYERYVGYGKKFIIGFGFPNARAMRVAELSGLYDPVDKIIQLTWSGCGERYSFLNRASVVSEEADENTRQQINDLWLGMAQDLGQSIVGVRNWKYISQRYFNCPEKNYHVILIKRRFFGTPIGVFVVRKEGQELLLLDIVAPLANFSELIHHARRLVVIFDAQSLRGWITKSHQDAFMVEGTESVETDIVIPGLEWVAGPKLSEVRDRWWLMSGDTDFL